MAQDLLERQSELQALDELVQRALAGSGSIALVAGEAGIGKSSLVRSFIASLPREVRVLAAGCEDLLTPRALGPLRDAVRGKRGPLSDALAADTGPDAVFPAVLDELGSGAPTVLVVDDAHWADGATLDVLRFLGRRVAGLPAVLLITYRDDELDARHPLRSVLGAMAGPDVLRLRLTPFSAATVTELAADSAVDAAELFRLTEGNPFFVTEVLTAPDVLVPPTVVDAVLARVGGVSPEAQAAVRQLAVVPSGAELGLVRRLVPDLAPIGEAEAAGVVTMRGEVLRFRHELARRAVAESTPVSVRADLHAAVLRVLTDEPDPDPCRVLHHAVGAGDDDAVIEYGQLAGRRAARAGAYRQAVSCFAFVLDRGARVPPDQLARVAEGQAWALANSNEFHAAAEAAATAVEQWGLAGSDTKLVRSLITLTRQLWLTERTSEALASARRALELAEPQGDTADHVVARLGLGGCLVLVDRETEGIEHLEIALELAERTGVHDLAALTHNYLGSARLQLGDLGGRDDLLLSVELARALPNHEYVMRGFYNLGEGLWRLGRYDEAMGFMEQAEAYAADRDFPAHSYMVEARRLRRLGMQGRWTEAVAGLRSMLDGRGDPGMIGRETLPILARLLVRQGDPDAESVLAESIRHAERADVLEWLVPTGLAAIEHAWLTGRPEVAGRFPELLLERTGRRGTDVQRGALLRNLKRLGRAVEPHPGCPPGYAAGILGDWRAAADAWEQEGDPYERALELVGSGDVDATLEGLAVLDRLGARPAAEAARVRLRELGVSRVPRRPGPGKIENPAGLTERQVEILGLLADGLSNAEIAARLVLSPRTVDHHVAAVLQKLDVHSRRDAVAVAGRLGLPLPD